MSPTPLPGNNSGRIPADQISIPAPPPRNAPDGLHPRPHTTSRADSYRENVVRIWPDGLGQPAVDLVPSPDEVTQTPEAVFGPEHESVFVVAGGAPPGNGTTRFEAANHLLRLRERLDAHGWQWRPTVTSSSDRQWVEGGALVLGRDLADVTALAALHGQPVVLRWDGSGMTAVPTAPGPDLDSTPVPVRLAPARTGCPLRRGGDVCQVHGGCWTNASRMAALAWQEHRELLLAAFGCDVCHGQGTSVVVGRDLHTPSRDGGWAVAERRPPSL